ncbi:snoaL-like domain protein [Mycobacterium xenopi 4042]|nr:snoaL-like domain protein [Mycobacterium xenopi 4042]
MLRFWRAAVVLYPDGTPRTKHVVTNPIIEIDEDAGTASCRSYYTVLQQIDDFPLQPIVVGRYHDGFERVDGAWRFCFRDYTLVDLVGDLSRHLSAPIVPGS